MRKRNLLIIQVMVKRQVRVIYIISRGLWMHSKSGHGTYDALINHYYVGHIPERNEANGNSDLKERKYQLI